MEVKKILVPIDFSKCSINALKIAAGIAKGQRAELEIINAIHVPAHPHADVGAAGAFIEPILSEYEEKIQDQFEDLKKEVPELKNVSFTTRKFVSVVTEAIRKCLRNDDIDLIIMGTKGSHDTLEKMIGSMSNEVIRFSNVPVLVIPENVDSFRLKKIGFAADLHEIKNLKKLEFMVLLAKLSKAEVKVFHISQKGDLEHEVDNSREKMRLMDLLSEVPHSYVWVDDDQVQEGILDFIDSHQLDLLTMYPRHHGLWDRIIHTSVTKKIAQKVKIPLLTIHE